MRGVVCGDFLHSASALYMIRLSNDNHMVRGTSNGTVTITTRARIRDPHAVTQVSILKYTGQSLWHLPILKLLDSDVAVELSELLF